MSNALQIFNDLPVAPDGYAVPPPNFLNAYWHNGKRELKELGGVKHFGGWCINADDVSEPLPAEWKLLTMTAQSGAEYQVMATETIHVAVLQAREFWMTKSENGERPTYYREYASGRVLKAELLCVARGIVSPVVLSAKVFNARNLLDAYARGYNTVKRAAKKNLAPYAVYLPLRGETREGQAVFTMVGAKEKSPITRIVFASTTINESWRVPDAIIAECHDSLELARQWKEAKFIEQLQTQHIDAEDE